MAQGFKVKPTQSARTFAFVAAFSAILGGCSPYSNTESTQSKTTGLSESELSAVLTQNVQAVVTTVDPSVDYIKIAWVAKAQTHSFPSIYVTKTDIPVNKWLIEKDIVFTPKDFETVS